MNQIDKRLGGMNSDLTHSDKTMNDIKRIRKTNRLILFGVGSTILLAVIVIVVLKFVD
jgi:t-SNARE complex subunit (syntaxin)